MIKKLFITAVTLLAFAANASALTGKGTFKKTTQTIKGSWTLTIVQDHQIIGFDKKFKTESAPDLKLVLTKKTLRSFRKDIDFGDHIVLAPLKSNEGFQYYVVPADVDISDYKSLVLHSEASNVVWGGFTIPRDRVRNGDDLNSVFDDEDRDNESYGS